MLKGKFITLRPVLEADLDALYRHHIDLDTRGDFYPHGIASQTVFRQRFYDTGYWGEKNGMLLIVDADDSIIGEIEFFKTLSYLDEYEIAYRLYGAQHHGKGAMTDALGLMVRYLFKTRQMNRIRLMIHPDNAASARVAEKCGFVFEGTARQVWYNLGRHQDLRVFAILHDDVFPPDEA
ncbi:GNAT family N-acetyltransferase [Aggregatilinea lenta]|uniref:GNAT family N-acetyltransferase n=1 Tax=Aggregatilinea lenta TaxID=913108 RepID=UPI000E5B6327|nr:GNAT family N-acetyltransferase [Aggregatilinea lenta]